MVDIDYSTLNAQTVDGIGDVPTTETPYERQTRLIDEAYDGEAPATDDAPDEGPFAEPSLKIVGGESKRPRKAIAYEAKMTGLLQTISDIAMASPQTIPDSAAIIMHGESVATAFGDLAANDPRVARGIDWITSGTNNPYAAVLSATLPLALQVLRNHEPVAESESKGIRIPFLKRTIKLRFKIKLGKLRNATNDPDHLVNVVFGNPDLQASLKEKGNWDNVYAVLTRRQRKQQTPR